MRTICLLWFITQVLLINANSQDKELREQYRRNAVRGTEDYNIVCTQEPLELGIVLDTSSSIHEDDFKTCKKFLQDYLQQFDVGAGPRNVRVSLITYARGIYIPDSFNLNTYSLKSDVINAIGRVPHREGDDTYTNLGIEHMYKVQMADNVVRPGVVKVGLIITDGQSRDPKKTLSAAQAARAHGIVTFALGVGKTVNETELLGIAGDPQRKFSVGNFNELKSITEVLAKKTCVKEEKPTTEPPADQPCGELHPSDIYFVFSQVSLGSEGTQWTTSFIRETVDSSAMKVGFRYGVISGSCPDDAGFDLDDYNNVDDIKLRLLSYEERKLPSHLQRLSEDGYTIARGARPGASKVAVLFTQSEKDIRKESIQNLLQQSVKVYLADPSNSGLDVPGTTRLSGSSVREQVNNFIEKLCQQRPDPGC